MAMPFQNGSTICSYLWRNHRQVAVLTDCWVAQRWLNGVPGLQQRLKGRRKVSHSAETSSGAGALWELHRDASNHCPSVNIHHIHMDAHTLSAELLHSVLLRIYPLLSFHNIRDETHTSGFICAPRILQNLLRVALNSVEPAFGSSGESGAA